DAGRPAGGALVILGFAGGDPRLLSRWREEGALPHLKALAARGEFRPLTSTNPPQSPVAWTSFATGTGPARHGIFDFVERDPATYLPDVGTGGVRPPRFVWGLFRTAHAEAYSRRQGTPFWDVAAAHGVRVTVLRVPWGGWSAWYAFRLPVVAPLGLPLVTVAGLCRFHVVSVEPLRIYLSPLNYAPAAPFVPISAPAGYAGELAAALGPYKTVGWSEDTASLNAERVDEEAFLADLH